MSTLQLCVRVFGLLRAEARLAMAIVVANILLAGAQFADPVLFGRIVDGLTGSQGAGRVP